MKKIRGQTYFLDSKNLELLISLMDVPVAMEARKEWLSNMIDVEYSQDLGPFLGGSLEFKLKFDKEYFDKNGGHS